MSKFAIAVLAVSLAAASGYLSSKPNPKPTSALECCTDPPPPDPSACPPSCE